MGRIKIKGTGDWVIFWIFAGLISYVSASHLFEEWVKRLLLAWGSPWMSIKIGILAFYGRVIAAVIIMAVLADFIVFLCRKPVKLKLAVWIGGALCVLSLIGICELHCKLLISQLWSEYPDIITVGQGGAYETFYYGSEDGDEKREYEKILQYCRSLVVVEEEEELEQCRRWYDDLDTEEKWNGEYIELYFNSGATYTHSIRFCLGEGYIYLERGYGSVAFYKDNE